MPTQGSEGHHVKSMRSIYNYVLGGRAVFTLANPESGVRFTYRMRRAMPRSGQAEDEAPFYVDLLTGPDNEADFQKLALLWTPIDGDIRLSGATGDAPSHRGLRWLVRRLNEYADGGGILGPSELPPPMECHHDGTCARCGRALTVPESVESGFGPECVKHLG